MDFRSLKSAYDRDGIVVARQLLPPSDFAELTRELERYIRDVVPTLPDAHAFYEEKARPETLKQLQHMGLDAYFRAYREHAVWQALAEALVGEAVSPMEPEWFNKPPGTQHVTPPHQDNYYFCLRPPHVVTVWMALDAVDEENGCLRYVRGSHLDGIRLHGRSQVLGFSQGLLDYNERDREREVAIHLEPGDVVAHHGNTIHRAEANRSLTRNRRAFALVYKGVSCRRDEEAFARYQAALRSQHEQLGLTN
jgi:phytanoyl-CoA hydroxylase